ncbi:MAG: glycosyltransferase [Acidobacteriota bacterium]
MKYPKVLIVYHSCINKHDASCMSLRNWFADWPKERLAQIYSGNEQGTERFCGRTFRLGEGERRFSRMFFKLKGSPLGAANRPLLLDKGGATFDAKLRRREALRQNVSMMAINSGIWELMFPPIISQPLENWISDFNPDIVYSQGYDLSFAWLAVWILQRFRLPGCFHAVDDWPRFLYSNSIFSSLMRRYVESAAQNLLKSASVRFAIGEGMAAEYRSRYGVGIEPLMICDSLERFRRAEPRRMAPEDTISIIYSGGLGHYRWKSLVDLSRAANELEADGLKLKITVFTPAVPPEAVSAFAGLTNICFEVPPSHEELPSILKGGDILFLPETFDPAEADVIRLSVSTKAPLYMMSEKPTLVYSSPMTGVFDYAKRSGWAYVVDKQDVHLLARAIRRLHRDTRLKERLAARAIEVARHNHEASVVRERLRISLVNAAERQRMRSALVTA